RGPGAVPPRAGGPGGGPAAGGVTGRDGVAQLEAVLRCEHAEMIHRRSHVEEGVRPAASRIAQPAVLDVPRRQALPGERLAHRDHETEIVLRLPEATVHADHDRTGRSPRRTP